MRGLVVLVALVASTLLPVRASAAPPNAHLSWGSHLNPSDCPDESGYRYLEVNVTQRVDNDADLAPLGHYWALLEYNRHIQVWAIGIGGPPDLERYCVLVKYQGAWETIAGPSPNDPLAAIPAGIDGTFQGGYRALVVGKLDESGAVRLRGRIPPVNRGAVGLPFAAPAQDDWLAQYFPTLQSVSVAFWGWIYHGGPNGTFVHACDGGGECPGSSGNIE